MWVKEPIHNPKPFPFQCIYFSAFNEVAPQVGAIVLFVNQIPNLG
jgi:hypothetical protein